MNKKLINARRDVERLRLESGGATEADIAIWEATNTVDDLERKERQGAVHAARRAALAMDVALFAVAALVMAFSLGNIRGFALDHGIEDPIAAFIAPAVDLALVAALIGDAVLSRHQLDAGPWATRLRYVSGALTLVLNSWEAVAAADPAGIVLHAGMPILLFVLAEAASPYRRQFARTVQLAADAVDEGAEAPVSTPAATGVDTVPEEAPDKEPEAVYDQESDPAVSTETPQVAAMAGDGSPEPSTEADTNGGRLDAEEAKTAIEQAWKEGLTIREAAVRATRAPSYVGSVYARLNRERGHQPSKGQMEVTAA